MAPDSTTWKISCVKVVGKFDSINIRIFKKIQAKQINEKNTSFVNDPR